MDKIKVICGDNVDVLKGMPDNSVDSVVTDAPYGLGKEPNATEMLSAWIEHGYLEVKGGGFMGNSWDAFVPQPIFWKEVFRVLKPGGHVLCFFGTRTYDWGVMAMRLAGFEVKDQIIWSHGQGFPKSHNISLAIDKMHDAEREVIGTGKAGKAFNKVKGFGVNTTKSEDYTSNWDVTAASSEDAKKWDGYGTALKPAIEPIVLAKKPIEKGLSIAENVLKWGTGAINIDASRIEGEPWKWGTQTDIKGGNYNTNKPSNGNVHAKNIESDPKGRFPANLIIDGSDEVMAMFPNTKSGEMNGEQGGFGNSDLVFGENSKTPEAISYGDNGSAARFFYVAKPSKQERNWGLGETAEYALKQNSTMRDIENVDWKEFNENYHPTLKPVQLMRYLVKMITPPGGTCLDPFNGSGTTGIACKLEGFFYIGIEMTKAFCDISIKRIANWVDDLESMVKNKKKQDKNKNDSQTDLFS